MNINKINCIACGSRLRSSNKLLGLMPRGQISGINYKDNNFYTDNDIKFIWSKKDWKKSRIGCYGSIMHESCWDDLQKHLGIQVTFEDIYLHINNNNEFSKIKYLDDLEDTWTNFIMYKNSSLQRKRSCNKFRKDRCDKSYSIFSNRKIFSN